MAWLCLVVIAILMWAATSLLYKVGVYDDKEEHINVGENFMDVLVNTGLEAVFDRK